MRWLRWFGVNYALLLGLLIAGLGVLGFAGVIGWGDSESRGEAYVVAGLFAPFTGVLYLAGVALLCPRVSRPRVAALALTPLFWAAVPIFAIGVAAPGITALWVVYLSYGALVRLPPSRRTEPAARAHPPTPPPVGGTTPSPEAAPRPWDRPPPAGNTRPMNRRP